MKGFIYTVIVDKLKYKPVKERKIEKLSIK